MMNVKKDVYDAKINNIEYKIPDITILATNNTLNTNINWVKNNICSITNLAKTAALNAKINEVKNKITDISNLAATTVLTSVEKKIPHHSKYITTAEFNKLTIGNFAAKLAKAILASKNDITDFVKR